MSSTITIAFRTHRERGASGGQGGGQAGPPNYLPRLAKQFSSVQFKMVSVPREKPIWAYAPPRLPVVSPTLPFKAVQPRRQTRPARISFGSQFSSKAAVYGHCQVYTNVCPPAHFALPTPPPFAPFSPRTPPPPVTAKQTVSIGSNWLRRSFSQKQRVTDTALCTSVFVFLPTPFLLQAHFVPPPPPLPPTHTHTHIYPGHPFSVITKVVFKSCGLWTLLCTSISVSHPHPSSYFAPHPHPTPTPLYPHPPAIRSPS